MNKRRPLKLWKPVNLNPADFGKLGDRVVYLTHTLYVKRFFREERKRSLAEWVPLKAVHLRRIMGKPYRQAIDACREAGVLEYDERRHYSPGRFSKHYRIRERYIEAGFELYEIRDPNLRGNLAKCRLAERNEAPLVYQHVMQWLDQLIIDDIPDDVIRQAAEHAPRRQKSKESWDAAKRYEFFQHQIENVRQNAIPPIRDTYGRLHSTLTTLKSDFRPYLRINGEALVSVDITTSQPLFFGLFVEKYMQNNNKLHPNTTQITTQSNNTTHNNPHPTTHTLMLCTKPDNIMSAISSGDSANPVAPVMERPEDVERYFQLIENGDLYVFLQKEAGWANMTRTSFKHNHFFSMLYGPNLLDTRLLLTMKRLFPTVFDVLWETKRVAEVRDIYSSRLRQGDSPGQARKYVKKHYSKWYGEAAREMQVEESDFVFNRVVKRLMTESPGVPVLTIHDSVLTTVGNEGIVSTVMMEEFRKLGVAPQLKVEFLADKEPDALLIAN